MILSLDGISKGFADNLILDDIHLSVDESDRIGLVGANGTGKTTLLNILCKKSDSDLGEVSYKSGLSVGYLEQGSGLNTQSTILGEMLSVFKELLDVQERMRELESEIAVDGNLTLADEYARLSEYFERNEGYNIEIKVKTVLNGMGFLNWQFDTDIRTMSGGEKTRLALAKLLLSQPQLLVLDEPTNHLDFKTLMWLEDYLNDYKGALVVVSHDRYFLDKIVKQIWEVESAHINTYKGNYTKYKQLKSEHVTRQQREYDQTERRAAAMLEYAQKNIARASTSNSAKGRLKQLANMERVQKPLPPVKPPNFSFDYDKESVKEVLTVSDFDLTVGDESKLLVSDVGFKIRRGEKVAIIGDNGTGKSTLLKSIIEQINNDDTHIVWGRNVAISYYDQENRNMNFNNTVMEELHSRFPTTPAHQIRTLLGRVRMTDDNVFKSVSVVSGGERAKLGLAIVMAERTNTVVMDEPTNHLDLESKESLEKALCEFSGTLIFVSHDRYFLNSVPDRIIELTKNGINCYNGGFDFYISQTEQIEKQKAQQEQKIKKIKQKESGYKSKTQRNEDALRRSRRKELEILIEKHEAKISELELQVADDKNASDYALLNELYTELEKTKTEHDQAFEEWLLLEE